MTMKTTLARKEWSKKFNILHPDLRAYKVHKCRCKNGKHMERGEFLVAYKILKSGIKCQICKLRLAAVIDHNHLTGKFRGLICRYCNTGMGFWDNFKQEVEKYACSV